MPAFRFDSEHSTGANPPSALGTLETKRYLTRNRASFPSASCLAAPFYGVLQKKLKPCSDTTKSYPARTIAMCVLSCCLKVWKKWLHVGSLAPLVQRTNHQIIRYRCTDYLKKIACMQMKSETTRIDIIGSHTAKKFSNEPQTNPQPWNLYSFCDRATIRMMIFCSAIGISYQFVQHITLARLADLAQIFSAKCEYT